jgi:spore coat polysaccharide biosynthesis predicted glycosyltransferase SpsG
MRVLFRADATQEIGAGHVMRCWALAEELATRGASVSWQGTIDVPWVRAALDGHGWNVVAPLGSSMDQALGLDADAVIVDSYTLDEAYRQTLLNTGTPVVAIVDDSYTTAGPASLWVNPGAPSSLQVDDAASFLNGPEYVLIRRAVRDLRRLRQESDSSQSRATGITFLLGGTDFAGLAPLIDGMPGLSERAGGLFAGPGVQGGVSKVKWLSGGPDLLRRASQSRLVVSAAGVSSWEMAHVGVPLALMQVAGNQAGNYSWMTQTGWALPLGDVSPGVTQPAAFEQALTEALMESDAGGVTAVSRIDGLGAARVAEAVISLM